MALPSLFLSHGPPTLAIDPSPARDFLSDLGTQIERPAVVLCISAHWESLRPAVSLAERPETIHDFGGFPDELYRISYAAPGAPALAQRVVDLLEAAGLRPVPVPDRGLDHGAWVPLMLAYPAADIPVVQLSMQSLTGPAAHYAIGRALAPLRDEGVLIVGSGGAVHNLRHWFNDPDEIPAWATAFDEWLAATVEAGAVDDLVDYRSRAPEAATAHPSEDHFLPLHVALGAAGENVQGRVLHRSFQGSLSMAAYAFA